MTLKYSTERSNYSYSNDESSTRYFEQEKATSIRRLDSGLPIFDNHRGFLRAQCSRHTPVSFDEGRVVVALNGGATLDDGFEDDVRTEL